MSSKFFCYWVLRLKLHLLRTFKSPIFVFIKTFKLLRIAKKNPQQLPDLKILWAQSMLKELGLRISCKGLTANEPGVLFVGNHISYLDIPLLMSFTKDISFVAKAEIAKWPIIGPAAIFAGTVFVRRDSLNSRKAAREAIERALAQGKRIAIFPSGTTTIAEDIKWKRGAFKIAREHGVIVQPFRIKYTPRRVAAYIDDDTLFIHLFGVVRADNLDAEIEFHPPMQIHDLQNDIDYIQNWVRSGIDLQ